MPPRTPRTKLQAPGTGNEDEARRHVHTPVPDGEEGYQNHLHAPSTGGEETPRKIVHKPANGSEDLPRRKPSKLATKSKDSPPKRILTPTTGTEDEHRPRTPAPINEREPRQRVPTPGTIDVDEARSRLPTPAASSEEGDLNVHDRRGDAAKKELEIKVAPDILLSFGPDLSYIMRLRNRWWCHNVQTEGISSKLLSTLMAEMDIVDPYVIGLAPEHGFFLACKDSHDTHKTLSHLRQGTRNSIQIWMKSDKQWTSRAKCGDDTWKVLQDWLTHNFNRDYEQLREATIVFGTGNSFYARISTDCLWNNLPEDLENIIVEQMEDHGKGPPRYVSLGFQGTWIIVWDDNSCSWNLGSHYEHLQEKLQADSSVHGGITAVVLDPYSSSFFLHHQNGLIEWDVDFGAKGNQEFAKRCQTYMQERARQDKTTFHLRKSSKTASKSGSGYAISPSTNYDLGNGFASKFLGIFPAPKSWKRSVQGFSKTMLENHAGLVGFVVGATLGVLTIHSWQPLLMTFSSGVAFDFGFAASRTSLQDFRIVWPRHSRLG